MLQMEIFCTLLLMHFRLPSRRPIHAPVGGNGCVGCDRRPSHLSETLTAGDEIVNLQSSLVNCISVKEDPILVRRGVTGLLSRAIAKGNSLIRSLSDDDIGILGEKKCMNCQ
jgi:hypothetical protein